MWCYPPPPLCASLCVPSPAQLYNLSLGTELYLQAWRAVQRRSCYVCNGGEGGYVDNPFSLPLTGPDLYYVTSTPHRPLPWGAIPAEVKKSTKPSSSLHVLRGWQAGILRVSSVSNNNNTSRPPFIGITRYVDTDE
jgi:hypothetical protein